jgi:protein-S-isoprenylcysteine O-methyltransferase Ste14
LTPDLESRPYAVPWPPLIVAAALVVALAGELAFHVGLDLGAFGRWLGWALIVAGVGVNFWGVASMRRAGVNLMPHRSATGLVTSGAFAFTRNPIYLGTIVAFVGLGAAANSLWLAVAALFAAKLIEIVAIRREEAHLALLFGPQWKDYAARAPRWLGPAGWGARGDGSA